MVPVVALMKHHKPLLTRSRVFLLQVLGNITLADGTTVVTASTDYTSPQIQGMKFVAAANANGSRQLQLFYHR